LTGISIISYSAQQKKDAQKQAVLRFVSDLRRAQNMAMSVIDCNGIQEKYGLSIINTNTYQVTCDNQDVKLPVDITGSDIYFLPISEQRLLLEVESPQVFTIGTQQITVTKQGNIIYE